MEGIEKLDVFSAGLSITAFGSVAKLTFTKDPFLLSTTSGNQTLQVFIRISMISRVQIISQLKIS